MKFADISVFFKVAFFTLLGFTIFFVLLAVVLSVLIAEPTKSQSSAEAWLFKGASSTLSALIGLMVGRVA